MFLEFLRDAKNELGAVPAPLDMTNLWDHSVTELLRLLKSRELSVTEYTQCLIERCERHRDLNAFIYFDAERILTAARQADRYRRKTAGHLGLLLGVPVVLKDNIDVKDLPTTAGTPALQNHRPRKNAGVVTSLLKAGAIPFGKANMHELAQGVTNNNTFFGACRNPYNSTKIPGGSSGGCAVAVAARLAAAAIGTDTGGSVRIPASLCGIVGFRPSAGRYPQKGIVPISHTRDTAGPMTRSVADTALLDRVLSQDPQPIKPTALKEVRLGVPRKPFYTNIDADTLAVIEAGLGRLKSYGIELIEADIPEIDILDQRSGFTIAGYEMIPDLEAYLQDHHSNPSTSEIISEIASPDVKRILLGIIDQGDDARTQYLEALNIGRRDMQNRYRQYFHDHSLDGIVFPTTPLPATPIGEDDVVILNAETAPLFQSFIRNTSPGSVAGIPGISLPVGLTSDRLPVGMEIDGPLGSDRRLLAIAMAVEKNEPSLPKPILI